MLHIILTLLKIIGMFLLILLGILLLLIVAVLAAPVTYDFSGGWDGQPDLRGRIHWLYHIVGISVYMKDMRPELQISIFGRVPGSEKKKEASKKNGKTGKKKADLQVQPSPAEESDLQEEPYPAEEPNLQNEPVPETQPALQEESLPTEKSGPEEQSEQQEESLPDSEEIMDLDALLDKELEKAEKERAGLTGMDEMESGPDYTGPEESESDGKYFDEDEEKPQTEGNPVFAMIHKGIDFLNRPSVCLLAGKLWKCIRRIIRHLRPSGLQIQARIGTGDPALTGKIMELAAVLYAFYNENIEIISEFDEKVLEARFSVRGWLVPGYLIVKLLGMALRIYFSRECRTFYREIKESLS